MAQGELIVSSARARVMSLGPLISCSGKSTLLRRDAAYANVSQTYGPRTRNKGSERFDMRAGERHICSALHKHTTASP